MTLTETAEITPFLLLRKTPFQDCGFIVAGVSPQFGRIDFLIRGARSIGKKKFPLVGLFREYSVGFRFPKSFTGQILLLSSMELQISHDNIASHLPAYLRACRLATFLLRNIPMMSEISVIWNAFSIALSRLESESPRPELTSALFMLVYAYEQGVFPSNIIKNSTYKKMLMTCAMHPDLPLPAEIPVTVLDCLCSWADSMESAF